MNIRNLVLSLLAAAALSGCYTGYGYRGGAGDYYYGSPSVDYYGLRRLRLRLWGLRRLWRLRLSVRLLRLLPGVLPGLLLPAVVHAQPASAASGPSVAAPAVCCRPDSGVRYPSRAQGALERSQRIQTSPQSLPPSQGRYPSRVPQMRSGLETRGGPAQVPPPPASSRPLRASSRAPPSAEPRFESRPPRMDSGGRNPVRSGSSSRERDRGRVQNP